ncbi:AAA domain family protein [Burkholderia pseudomallei MSHR5613]|uniref:ATP-binding protein n=1 Tax=Burkholderia pseudomallei TaxID=28450 RepID=UPI000531E86E|nr:ATP-binding protein [Burkholderia pseudomallei]KGS55057.1 AAA domain family protein [Burkholderia pseudomallei MSHR5613]
MNPTNEAGAATAAASDDRALPAAYPFSALIGQAALQQALLLVAVDPGLGGVLVSGPRGTAKSTAARALAELLPEGRFVTLPLSASDEQVTGSLDLARALADNTVRFSPGLVARAHLGVLYVDEINLLPDALVDALLDAAASGVNTVERDGVSHSHAARFALVGTMNPEEGELRPQLLDRFGLMVELANCYDAATRQRIVKARLAFDLDPHGFRAQYRDAQAALVAQIRAARAALPALAFDDAAHARVAELCIGAAVDGLRGDLVMLRAARALAALDGAASVAAAHVERVAADVLRHRRTRFEPQPEFQPGFQPGSQAGPQPMGRREPPPASRSAGGDAPGGLADPGEAEATRAPTPRDALPGGASGPAHPAARAPSDAQRRAADERGAARDGGRGPAADDSDWGYLPPEPAGIAPVKGVIPLPLKKR